jgi:hypothetical protein
MYATYYASMLRYWQLVRILVRTNHSCLRVECHSWYQSLTSVIRTHVITHISGHVCDALCVNASVLATLKDPGKD